MVPYSPACSEIPISRDFNCGNPSRTEKMEDSSKDLHFLLPGFWNPCQLGTSLNWIASLGFGATRGCAGGRHTPVGLRVSSASPIPGDNSGNRQFPSSGSNGAVRGCCHPLWFGGSPGCLWWVLTSLTVLVPPWVFLLSSTVYGVMNVKVQVHLVWKLPSR